jgi:hypothetical protein
MNKEQEEKMFKKTTTAIIAILALLSFSFGCSLDGPIDELRERALEEWLADGWSSSPDLPPISSVTIEIHGFQSFYIGSHEPRNFFITIQESDNNLDTGMTFNSEPIELRENGIASVNVNIGPNVIGNNFFVVVDFISGGAERWITNTTKTIYRFQSFNYSDFHKWEW